jgi:hypothetical protein
MLYLFNFLEILFSLTGVYSIRTSKLPPLITGPKYKVEGKSIRFLGFIMLIPATIGFISGFILGYKSFGSNGVNSSLLDLANTIQIASIIIVTFVSIIFIMENVRPNEPKTLMKGKAQE